MTKPGASEETLVELLTVAMLRAGFDTQAARAAKVLTCDDDYRGLARRIALSLFIEPAEAHLELSRARGEAERARGAMQQPGTQVISILDSEYPTRLREIADPPLFLWTQGDLQILESTTVAVVGSRDATPASLALARKLGRELSEAGVTVVSGMALGIDGEAHVGALDGPSPTVAVLGSGLSHVYPKRHTPLAERIRRRGVVLTEFPPWFLPYGRHFPLRNRIISGLSEGVVVVEASENSGSLITAKLAGDQNRDVMAVPGGPLSGRYRGCHALIKDGARLVETVDDILDEIGWPTTTATAQNSAKLLQLSDLEKMMAEGEYYSVDDLATRTGRSAADLLPELAELELSGRVTRVAGGLFARLHSRR